MAPTYANKRPESPKGQVYLAWASGGEKAAAAKAKELQIAQGKLDRWYREWGDDDSAVDAGRAVEASKADVEAPAPQPAKTAKPRGKSKQAPSGPRERVYDIGNPNMHGDIIKRGEQVSEVKWDGPHPWGTQSFVSNEKLKAVESEPTDRERATFQAAKCFRVMRKDVVVATHERFTKACQEAEDDCGLWVFAVSAGGSVALLMRPHWEQYKALLPRRNAA